MKVLVGQIERAIGCHTHVVAIDGGVDGRSAVTGEAEAPGTGHGLHDPVGSHAADAAVAPVRDVDHAVGAHGDAMRKRQLAGNGGGAIAQKAPGAGSGNGCDGAGGQVHPTNAMVEGVGNQDAEGRVKGQAARAIEARSFGGAAIATGAASPGAGQYGDRSAGEIHRVDVAGDVVGEVEDVGRWIQCDAKGIEKPHRSGRLAIHDGDGFAPAGDGGDGLVAPHPANPGIAAIAEIEVALGIN